MAEAARSLPKESTTEWEKAQPFAEAYNQAVIFYLHNTCTASFKMIRRKDVEIQHKTQVKYFVKGKPQCSRAEESLKHKAAHMQGEATIWQK